MTGPINGQELIAVKKLIEAGIIPPLCRRVTFNFEVNNAAMMNLEVFVTREQMDKIADAIAEDPEEAKAIAREVLFLDEAGRREAKVTLP